MFALIRERGVFVCVRVWSYACTFMCICFTELVYLILSKENICVYKSTADLCARVSVYMNLCLIEHVCACLGRVDHCMCVRVFKYVCGSDLCTHASVPMRMYE